MHPLRCLNCGRSTPRNGNPHIPFCSRRCQLIDLGRWLGERYGLPWDDPQRPDADDQFPASSDEDQPSTPYADER
jgi:endogenous inhibitor of DNA gyrase (YacG/DUF329 family)